MTQPQEARYGWTVSLTAPNEGFLCSQVLVQTSKDSKTFRLKPSYPDFYPQIFAEGE